MSKLEGKARLTLGVWAFTLRGGFSGMVFKIYYEKYHKICTYVKIRALFRRLPLVRQHLKNMKPNAI